MNPAGELHSPFEGSVGNHHAVNTAPLQVSSHKIAHFPRANEHHRFIVETVKDSFGQFDSHRTHRDPATRNSGFPSHSLGNGKERMKKPVKNRSDSAGCLGSVIEFL